MVKLVESLADLSRALPGPEALCAQRAAALAAFRAHGIPRTSQEDWRYTDLSRLADTPFEFVAPNAAGGVPDNILPIDAQRIVFVNARAETGAAQPQLTAAGVEILTNDWNGLPQGFPLNDAVTAHPLGQLNTAATEHGVLLRPTPANGAERVIHVVFAATGTTSLVLQPRVVIDLPENTSARVVLQFVSDNTADQWTNAVVEIRQAQGSRLDLLQLQEQSTRHTQTTLIHAHLQRDARASIGCFDLGAQLARNDVDVVLAGAGSEVDVFGAFLPLEAQLQDNHIRIDHAAAHTNSTATFRGIAGDRSRGVFNGKVVVRPDAQKIAARQSSDNLLLSANAEIDTKPELEIYADDVKCAHGATVGELDEQHLFYLRSRGVDIAAARALLTFAFAQVAVEHIADTQLRRLIGERIAARLPEHERWERLG